MSAPDLAERCVEALKAMDDEKEADRRRALAGTAAAVEHEAWLETIADDRVRYFEEAERRLVDVLRDAQKLVDAQPKAG